MVSTLGLTRSNGSVSHAGNSTTESGGMNWQRSSYSCPASVPVGCRDQQRTAIAELGERGDRDGARRFRHGDERAGLPKAWVSPVSSRSRRGSEASDIWPLRVAAAQRSPLVRHPTPARDER